MESEAGQTVAAEPTEELGGEIARLRHARGMTGQALAGAVGTSQSSISKIENGLQRVSPADAERIAQALQARPEDARRLVELAEQGRVTAQSRRATRRRAGAGRQEPARRLGVSLDQQEILDAEQDATLIREFEPILLPGLLQVSEYARRVVNGYHRITIGGDETSWHQRTAEKVSQRIRRQNLLYKSDRRFEFILMESVLGNRFAPPEDMIGQIKRISSVAEMPNVTVRIVPSSTQLEYPHVQGFTILDESLVVVETLEATGYEDPDQIRIYGKIFEEYAALSAADPLPILGAYMDGYAALLAPRRGESPSTSPGLVIGPGATAAATATTAATAAEDGSSSAGPAEPEAPDPAESARR